MIGKTLYKDEVWTIIMDEELYALHADTGSKTYSLEDVPTRDIPKCNIRQGRGCHCTHAEALLPWLPDVADDATPTEIIAAAIEAGVVRVTEAIHGLPGGHPLGCVMV